MHRTLLVVIAAVVVVKVAASDAKHAPPPQQIAPRLAAVHRPPPPPPPMPVLEVIVDEEAPEVEPDDPDVHADIDDGIDLDVALERARTTAPTIVDGTGRLVGRFRDTRGDSLAGVTITVASPSSSGVLVAITDDTGWFAISGVRPGTYVVTAYYLETVVEWPEIVIASNKNTPLFHSIETEPRPIEPPTFEVTIDQDYIRNIPVPGRTFESVLGSTDDEGISISGGTMIENVYVVEDDPAVEIVE